MKQKPGYNKEKVKKFAQLYAKGEQKKSLSLLQEYMKEQELAKIEYYKQNPVDAPNDVLKYAILDGVGISNDFILGQGDFFQLFKIGKETFYCWTYSEENYSLIIVEVDPSVKENDLWKTGASILETAFTIHSELESILEFDYDWIYRFDSSISLKEQHYLKDRDQCLRTQRLLRIPDFSDLANVIELLYRDDSFYVACQNIIAAKKNHEFCQICALTPEHLRHHSDNEPEIWEKASQIPQMEAAIVQSTRSVEALLGQPGNRETPSKLRKVKERWNKNISLDPESEYKLVGKSFLDYYYDLFNLRGYAAHSLGKLSYQMKRCQTIEAQSFAWIVIFYYYKKHCIEQPQALNKLNFNLDLVNKWEGVNVSSTLGRNSKYAP